MRQPLLDPSQKAGFLQELIRYVVLAWRLFWDARVAGLVKAVPILVIAYLISPIDLIPDWLLGLGQLDDLAILLLGIRAFVGLCPPQIVQEHLDRLSGKPPTAEQDETVDGTFRRLDE